VWQISRTWLRSQASLQAARGAPRAPELCIGRGRPGKATMRYRAARVLALGLIAAAVAPACAAGTTTRVSVSSGGVQGNEESAYLSISADGRFVAFLSDATNLVPGDTNGQQDVFARDRVARPAPPDQPARGQGHAAAPRPRPHPRHPRRRGHPAAG